jgi:hypothetical protein
VGEAEGGEGREEGRWRDGEMVREPAVVVMGVKVNNTVGRAPSED